jgi:hypothetical protein
MRKMHIRTRAEWTLGLLVIPLLLAYLPVGVAGQTSDPLQGVWSAEQYLLADGTDHELRGRIFFAERHWQVLFFVIDDFGEPRRGSGEGGTYERTADGVVFRHLFNLSAGEAMFGLEEAPLRMIARSPEDAPLEPTRVLVDGDVLTLYFPSGNRMTFSKATPRP